MANRFDLVVFDIGSVLVEAGRTLADDIRLAGFVVEPEWLAEFDARLHLHPRPGVGAIDIDRYYEVFAEASHGVFTVQDGWRMATAGLVKEHAGIATVFDALDAVGVDSALFSNITVAEWLRLFPDMDASSDLPTLPRARYRFASHLIRAQKPDAAAYAEVERGTGRSGDTILFFDEREENIGAARKRGWTAEWIDHSVDTVEQMLRLLRQHSVIE